MPRVDCLSFFFSFIWYILVYPQKSAERRKLNKKAVLQKINFWFV